jgi:predicted alpha/beta-hydrolase family hydrolase
MSSLQCTERRGSIALMASADWQIEIGQETDPGADQAAVVSAVLDRAETGTGTLLVCAHGAGGHMNDARMLAAAATLSRHGFDVLRFNFPYRERGESRPDPMPRLMNCVAKVADFARRVVGCNTLLLGGRSMGGRAASMLAADGYRCDGLVLLAYPLHPAGQPEKLRDAHLPRIGVPVLCFNGTRDTLCRRDLMERAIAPLGDRWTMHWLEGADHSFKVLRSSGRTEKDVLAEVGTACDAWRRALVPHASVPPTSVPPA